MGEESQEVCCQDLQEEGEEEEEDAADEEEQLEVEIEDEKSSPQAGAKDLVQTALTQVTDDSDDEEPEMASPNLRSRKMRFSPVVRLDHTAGSVPSVETFSVPPRHVSHQRQSIPPSPIAAPAQPQALS